MTTTISNAKAIILLLIAAVGAAKSAKSDNHSTESDNYLRGLDFNTRLQESNGVVSLGESSGIYLSLGDVGTYGIQVALYDKNMKPIIGSAWSNKEPHKWTTNRGRDGKAGFAGAHGYNMYDNVVKNQAKDFMWNAKSKAEGDFDYIEAQQFAFSNEDGQNAAWIKFTVANPNNEGGKFRVDIGSHHYGTYDSSGWVEDDSSKQVVVDYAGWKKYSLSAHPNETPPPIHASIVSLNPNGTPRGNRHLMLFISFRDKQVSCDPKKEHCCNIKYTSGGGLETYTHGFKDMKNNCDIVPPRHFCKNNVGSYKGSLMNMQDGLPINIFFEDDAELGLGINNRQWNFKLDNTQSCNTLCKALNGDIVWDVSAANDCQITNDGSSFGSSMNGPKDIGLGKLSIRGFGRISGYYLMSDPVQNLGDWYLVANQGCNSLDCTGSFSLASKKIEWAMRSGLIDITSSAAEYANNIAHDIRNVQTVWGCKRGDGNIQLSAGQGNQNKDFNKKAFVYDVKQIGNWPDAADGIELYGDGSSAWHTFQQCTDDCLKLQANDVTFFATTLVSGSVGGAVNSGAYGDLWGHSLDLHNMKADGVWCHRCIHVNGGYDKYSGIVRIGSCPKKGFIMKNVVVNDLYIPSYGGNIVNFVDALFSMGSLDPDSDFCKIKKEDAAGPEMYDSSFSNFHIYVQPTRQSQLYANYKDGFTIFDNINFDRIFIYKTGDGLTGWYTVCGQSNKQEAMDNCVDSDGLGHMVQNLFYNGNMLKLSSINFPYGIAGVNEMKD